MVVGGGWDPVRMIVSLLYRAARTMLSIPAVLLRRDTAKDAELLVLRHENTVLRRQLKGPVRYESADRFWFSALSSLIPRRRWAGVFPVTPGTVLAWHRKLIAKKWDYSARRSRTGRPPTVAALRKLVRLSHGSCPVKVKSDSLFGSEDQGGLGFLAGGAELLVVRP